MLVHNVTPARVMEPATRIYGNVFMGGRDSVYDASFEAAVCLQMEYEKANDYPHFGHILHIPTLDYTGPSRQQMLAALDFIRRNDGRKLIVHFCSER